MVRLALLVEYDGSAFYGLQRQRDEPTVQSTLEAAARGVFGEVHDFVACGRTDRGVHAAAMPVSLEVPDAKLRAMVERWMPEGAGDAASRECLAASKEHRLKAALQAWMRPHPLAILQAVLGVTFDVRRSAISRSYRYRIVNRVEPAVLERGRCWRVGERLNLGLMREASRTLLGHHDFSSFRGAGCQAPSPFKTIRRFDWHRAGEQLWCEIESPSFLYHQVRNMVGSLVHVGRGEMTPKEFEAALLACNRKAAGPTAPSDGLYFWRAEYRGFTFREAQWDGSAFPTSAEEAPGRPEKGTT